MARKAASASGSRPRRPRPPPTTSLSVPIDTGVIRGADNGVREHSIVFTASNGVGSVQSQPYEWETEQDVLCDRCF